MCAYVFLSEPPPVPRSIRRETAELAREVPVLAEELMECVVEALVSFPDAYRAVLRLMEARWPATTPERSP